MTRADQIDEYGVATITHEGDNYAATLEVDWAAEWCGGCEQYPDQELVFSPDLEGARVLSVTSPTGLIYGGAWHDRALREFQDQPDHQSIEQVWDAAGCGRGRDPEDYEED